MPLAVGAAVSRFTRLRRAAFLSFGPAGLLATGLLLGGAGLWPVISRHTEMESELREPTEAASPAEPTVIFDPARLAAQLSELLELYLARAKEALLEEQMSSKEAVACAKQVSGMLEDTQSGKLAKVDTSTDWPRLEFARVGGTGVGGAGHGGAGDGGAGDSPAIRHRPESIPHPRTRGFSPANLAAPPIQSLADAVSAVCQYDPETAILEPWERVLIRLNQLTQRVAADVEAWKASCADSAPTPESRLSSRDSVGEESRLENRDSSLNGTGAVGARHAVPVTPLAESPQSTGEKATSRRNPSSLNPAESPPNHGRDARATDSASNSQPPATSKTSGAIRRRKTSGGQEAPRTRVSSLSGSWPLDAGRGFG